MTTNTTNSTDSAQVIAFFYAGVGFLILISLSVMGSSMALYKSSTVSMFYFHLPSIAFRSYFVGGVSISIFFFALILVLMMGFSILNDSLTIQKSLGFVTSATIYGIVAYFAGNGIGDSSKYFFEGFSKGSKLNIPFFLIISMFELLVLMAMIIALVIHFANK